MFVCVLTPRLGYPCNVGYTTLAQSRLVHWPTPRPHCLCLDRSSWLQSSAASPYWRALICHLLFPDKDKLILAFLPSLILCDCPLTLSPRGTFVLASKRVANFWSLFSHVYDGRNWKRNLRYNQHLEWWIIWWCSFPWSIETKSPFWSVLANTQFLLD